MHQQKSKNLASHVSSSKFHYTFVLYSMNFILLESLNASWKLWINSFANLNLNVNPYRWEAIVMLKYQILAQGKKRINTKWK